MKGQTILFLTLFSAYFSLSMVNPLLGPLFRELHLSALEASLIFSIAAVSLFMASPLWGNRIEKSGKESILITGTFHFSLCYIFFALTIQLGLSQLLPFTLLFLLLFLIRLYGGIVFAAMLTSSQAFIADMTSKRDRSSGMALMGAANGLGLIIGPAIGSFLVGIHYTIPVYLAALFPFCMALALRKTKALPTRSVPVRGNEPSRIRPFDKRIFPFLLIGLSLNLILVILQVTVGYYLQDCLNMPVKEAARLASFSLVALGFALFISQMMIVSKFKPSYTYMLTLGFPLLLIGFLIFLISSTYYGIIVSFAIVGFGSGFIIPGYLTAASLAVESILQGAVSGLVSAMNGIGAMIGPVIGSALYSMDPKYPYYFALLLITIFTILIYLIRPYAKPTATLSIGGKK
ncbi:MAG: MFS transporter [Thermoactinomyces sp.]